MSVWFDRLNLYIFHTSQERTAFPHFHLPTWILENWYRVSKSEYWTGHFFLLCLRARWQSKVKHTNTFPTTEQNMIIAVCNLSLLSKLREKNKLARYKQRNSRRHVITWCYISMVHYFRIPLQHCKIPRWRKSRLHSVLWE